MRLEAIFSSHMVFAAGKPIRIFGRGTGRAQISFAGREVTVISEKDNWSIELEPMDFGGPYVLTAAFEDNTVVLDDIYIGKVILCAGQSNMQFKIKEGNIPPQLLRENQSLRMFVTDRPERERFSAKDGWVKAEKDNIGDWSALGYLAGNSISAHENVTVGIIGCYQGASMIESWVPRSLFSAEGITVSDDKKHHDFCTEPYSTWNGDGYLYNYSFSHIKPFSVSAVVWYQGESNTSVDGGKAYLPMLENLIKCWRGDLDDENLPFVVVQLADFTPCLNEGWRLVQKAQLDIERTVSRVKTVVSADVCETDNIHPPTKHLLAERIASALTELIN